MVWTRRPCEVAARDRESPQRRTAGDPEAARYRETPPGSRRGGQLRIARAVRRLLEGGEREVSEADRRGEDRGLSVGDQVGPCRRSPNLGGAAQPSWARWVRTALTTPQEYSVNHFGIAIGIIIVTVVGGAVALDQATSKDTP